MRCKRCQSHAINPGMQGRDETSDLDLCDVCYWRVRAESARVVVPELKWAKNVDAPDWLEAHTPFGRYEIVTLKRGRNIKQWRYWFIDEKDERELLAESVEAAQTACEAHWQTTMREALGLTESETRCRWERTLYDAINYYATDCDNAFEITGSTPSNMRFCPFCGKRIQGVSEDKQ